MGSIDESLGLAAIRIASDVEANCIISVNQIKKDKVFFEDNNINVKVTIFKKLGNSFVKNEYKTTIQKPQRGSIISIKRLLMNAVSKGYLSKGDRVIFVQDESLDVGYQGLLTIVDINKIFFNLSMLNLPENINTDVLESVIDIALEISNEGREGKHLGTAFVIGNADEISKYAKQLIINPFQGHDEQSRKITNPELRETIKNFAQLDGVFVIDNNGTILSAGTFIDIQGNELKQYSGLGTRHRCCAALTKETNAIAVIVSESGGIIRIFKNGQLIIKLP